MKWYISGPMSGLPKFNFQAFEDAATNLRAAGHDVVSPHEMDTPEMQAAAWRSATGSSFELPPGESWGTMLARDVQVIADVCGGIALLADWHKSRGARLEVVTGLLTDKQFALYHGGGTLVGIPRNYVIERLRF